MARRFKVGFIGCGSAVQVFHIPGYKNTAGVDLTAACDPGKKQREAVRRMCEGIRVYPDYKRMLAAEQLDMISVASPNRFHAEHALAALAHGAHVLLEKPPVLEMKDCRRIREAVAGGDRQLIVGFTQRHTPAYGRVRRLLEEGAIGEPYMVRIRFAHRGPYPGWAQSPWFYDPHRAGGGALLDMGIHAIDLALWLLGPVRSVQAMVRTLRKKIDVEDNAVLLLEFERSRTLGYIEAGWTSPAGFRGIEIMGDRGCVVVEPEKGLRLTTGDTSPDVSRRSPMRTRLLMKGPITDGWAHEIPTVVRALRRGEDLGSGIDAGAAALSVALAGYRSSRTGRSVDVAIVR